MHVRRATRSILMLAVVAAVAAPVVAQEFGEVAEQFRHNFDALRDYTWKSKSEFMMNGEVRTTEVFQVSYNDKGGLERTLIESEGKQTKQQDIAESTLNSIRGLIDGYVHMSPETLEAAFGDNARSVSQGKDGEPTRIRSTNVIARGDTMEVFVDPDTHRVVQLKLQAVMQEDPVSVVADFKESEDGGVNYAHHIVLTTQHKNKALRITRENYDLKRK